MKYFRRILSLVASVAMLAPLLSGCAKASELDGAIATLASGGVAVFDAYGSSAPIDAIAGTPSAMKLTRWQLSNMLAQADAHMGMLGSQIDAYEGSKAPKDAPAFSYFIAAWAKRGEGPLAQYAAQLMGTPDWRRAPQIAFPLLVVTLFIADAARMPAGAAPRASTSFNWERAFAAPALADGICSTVKSFVSQVVSDVTSALQVQSNGFFATLWNVAVQLVAGLASVVIGGVTTPLLSILNAVAGGLAVISAVASTLSPWTITVDAQPGQIQLGEQAASGQFVATLDAQAIDWPSQVSDCASSLGGVDLSKVGFADAPVTWRTIGQIPGFATVTSKDATIDANKRATLKYETVVAPSRKGTDACPLSSQNVGQGGVQVTIERSDVKNLQAQLANIAFSSLPGFVLNNLAPLFQSQLSSAQSQLAQLVANAPTGTGYVTFTELMPPPNCSPSPSPSPPQTTHPSGYTSADFIGTWKCDFTSGSASGIIYTTTPSIGITQARAVVRGYTTSETDDWTYAPSGPTTGVVTMTSPTRAAELQRQAAALGKPIPAVPPFVLRVTWLSHDHLTQEGSDGMHSASYNCTRM